VASTREVPSLGWRLAPSVNRPSRSTGSDRFCDRRASRVREDGGAEIDEGRIGRSTDATLDSLPTLAAMAQTGPHVSPLLVGRDDLLALADRRIAEVAAGQGHLLLLAGEPGIGKTRLLGSILRKAEAAGFRISKSDISPYDQLVVLASIHDLARWMDASEFGTLGAQIAEVDRGQGRDSLGSRRKLVRDIVELVLDALDRPTLLAFEDLQWADEMTLEVIAELARGGRDRPLFLLGAYRLDELPPGSIHREWRSRLLTQRLAEEVRLERLDKEQTALVTTLLLGTGLPAPREVADAVHHRTNGIPLHIEELLAAVGGAATDGRAILGAAVPDTIEDAILAHAGRLSEDARVVARAGAVMGRCFVPEVLSGVLDRAADELDEPLEELVREGILYPFAVIDEGYYDFRHQLLRDALYASVPIRDRRRLHARAAEFGALLMGHTGIHASAHFEQAGLAEQAFEAALAAAQEASAVSSHREAFDLYRRALQNLPASIPEDEQAGVWLAYSDAAGAVDHGDIARDAATRARELAQRAGNGTKAAIALTRLAALARREGEPIVDRRDLARRLMLEAERLPESAEQREVHLDALDLLGITERDDMKLDVARAYYEEIRDSARAWGNEEYVAYAEANLGQIDILATGSQVPVTKMIDGAAVSRAAGHETEAVDAYRDAAWFATRSLHYAETGAWIREGLKYAEEIEQSFCGHLLASTQAIVSWAAGDWDASAAQGGQAASDAGSARSRAMARWALGWVAACRGNRAEAEAHLRPALAAGRRSGWLDFVLPPQWGLAEAALMAGDAESAIRECESALTEARQRGEQGLLAPFVVTGVRAYQAAGRPDAAARWLDQIVRAIGPLAEVASPAISHGTGLVKLAEGSLGAAREALEAAVRAWDERGRRWEGFWARLDLAAANLRANRHAEAMALVREVEPAATELLSAPLLARAEQLTRSAKGRGAKLEAWHPLTVREFEVARKIAEGLTNAQIAEELFVSPKTVSAHVEHILAKLTASRRTEIATWVAKVVPNASPMPAAAAAATSSTTALH
jgi:DNA-binding CsgD family transcriptional regulator